MTTLTLIYAADTDGNFTDPKTGKCWDIPEDREFFRETIAGQTIICGRKTFEADWQGLKRAYKIVILSRTLTSGKREEAKRKFNIGKQYLPPLVWIEDRISEAISAATMFMDKEEEVFCIGGKKTIEAFAPLASRLLITHIGNEKENEWLPEYLLQGEQGRYAWWIVENKEKGKGYIRYDIQARYKIRF